MNLQDGDSGVVDGDKMAVVVAAVLLHTVAAVSAGTATAAAVIVSVTH